MSEVEQEQDSSQNISLTPSASTAPPYHPPIASTLIFLTIDGPLPTTLESDNVDRALRSKMEAVRKDRADWYYIISNDQGIQIASTSISKGSKETLRAGRVCAMARQLGLDTAQQLVDLIKCPPSREDALKIIERNRPPGTPRQHR